jgi:NTE family protein
MVLGLALGSGGARGWCHIGALRALDQMGVEADVVAGCSMGALVGAAWAGGKLTELENWARAFTQAGMFTNLDLGLDRGGLVQGKAVMRVLSEIGLPERIEDLDKPFLAVATDMTTGREVWLREGELAGAVRASVAIPGVFSPHYLDDRWLLDGALTNPMPTSAARALGATSTIAVYPDARPSGKMWEAPQPVPGLLDKLGESLPGPLKGMLATPKRETAPGYTEVVALSIEIMMEFTRKTRSAMDPPDVLLEADLLSDLSVLEFWRADEAIAEGLRIAREAEAQILDLPEVKARRAALCHAEQTVKTEHGLAPLEEGKAAS